jgi:hypothetical protein
MAQPFERSTRPPRLWLVGTPEKNVRNYFCSLRAKSEASGKKAKEGFNYQDFRRLNQKTFNFFLLTSSF